MENSRIDLPPRIIDVQGLICSASPPRPCSTTSVLGQWVTCKSCFYVSGPSDSFAQIPLCEQLMWRFTHRPHQSGSLRHSLLHNLSFIFIYKPLEDKGFVHFHLLSNYYSFASNGLWFREKCQLTAAFWFLFSYTAPQCLLPPHAIARCFMKKCRH